jgi:hypothetical protein
MARLTDLGLAKPDDPIFREGIRVSSPITARAPQKPPREKPKDDA